MTKTMLATTSLGGVLALGLLSGYGYAGEPESVPADDLVALSDALPAGDLAGQSGGTELIVDDVLTNYVYSNVQVNGSVSAGNDVNTGWIHDNVVSNVRGISTLMYNTGNNVSFSSNVLLNIHAQ
jgi:hypothetical protein